MPWPKYPCHPCSVTGAHAPRLARHGYAEASGYFWHSAMWNLVTGEWSAVCHQGHKKKGRKKNPRP